jgi:hypothetical protein
MADKDIVGGMFGITPEMYQQRADELAFAQAQRIGAAASGPGTMLSPSLAPFYTGAAQQGQMLSKGLGGLLGVEDPELSLVRQTSQLAQQIGVDTPEKLQTLAGELQKLPGGAALAVQAIEKANSMMKTGAEAQTAKQKIDQEKLLRDELAKLGDNATEEQYLQVFRKFGTPDQQVRAIEASIARKARLAGGTGPGGVKLSEGQKSLDKKFGTEYADFIDKGGDAVVATQLKNLDTVITMLENQKDISGKVIGGLDKLTGNLNFTYPDAAFAKDLVGKVVQSDLRAILGGQFARAEGEQLLQRSYDTAAPQDKNLEKVKDLRKQISDTYTEKKAKMAYFDEKGTLVGVEKVLGKKPEAEKPANGEKQNNKEVEFNSLPKRTK